MSRYSVPEVPWEQISNVARIYERVRALTQPKVLAKNKLQEDIVTAFANWAINHSKPIFSKPSAPLEFEDLTDRDIIRVARTVLRPAELNLAITTHLHDSEYRRPDQEAEDTTSHLFEAASQIHNNQANLIRSMLGLEVTEDTERHNENWSEAGYLRIEEVLLRYPNAVSFAIAACSVIDEYENPKEYRRGMNRLITTLYGQQQFRFYSELADILNRIYSGLKVFVPFENLENFEYCPEYFERAIDELEEYARELSLNLDKLI